jgi:hypothetical protein
MNVITHSSAVFRTQGAPAAPNSLFQYMISRSMRHPLAEGARLAMTTRKSATRTSRRSWLQISSVRSQRSRPR